MKILALIGSPRKKGNTDLLVEQILEGAKTKGMQQRSFTFMITLFLFVLIAVTAKKGITFAV